MNVWHTAPGDGEARLGVEELPSSSADSETDTDSMPGAHSQLGTDFGLAEPKGDCPACCDEGSPPLSDAAALSSESDAVYESEG